MVRWVNGYIIIGYLSYQKSKIPDIWYPSFLIFFPNLWSVFRTDHGSRIVCMSHTLNVTLKPMARESKKHMVAPSSGESRDRWDKLAEWCQSGFRRISGDSRYGCLNSCIFATRRRLTKNWVSRTSSCSSSVDFSYRLTHPTTPYLHDGHLTHDTWHMTKIRLPLSVKFYIFFCAAIVWFLCAESSLMIVNQKITEALDLSNIFSMRTWHMTWQTRFFGIFVMCHVSCVRCLLCG